MYIDITNASADEKYISGPEISIPAGETKRWDNVNVNALDSNTVIKEGVVAGDLTVNVVFEAADAAEATTGSLLPWALPKYLVANLPTGFEGRLAFATDGRKTGEGAGVGTGAPVYWSGAAWRTYPADAAVTV